jgi:hypothetical protein
MSAILEPRTADKLARICGLFGSNHAGERSSAAAMADEIIRTRGISWHQVISGAVPKAMPAYSTGEALDNIEHASWWEERFHFRREPPAQPSIDQAAAQAYRDRETASRAERQGMTTHVRARLAVARRRLQCCQRVLLALAEQREDNEDVHLQDDVRIWGDLGCAIADLVEAGRA